jgi:threonine aldolase
MLGTYDFKSDTVTLPTVEMIQAVATASLRDLGPPSTSMSC